MWGGEENDGVYGSWGGQWGEFRVVGRVLMV